MKRLRPPFHDVAIVAILSGTAARSCADPTELRWAFVLEVPSLQIAFRPAPQLGRDYIAKRQMHLGTSAQSVTNSP